MTKIEELKYKTNLLRKFVFAMTVFFTWVNFVNAQIIITEIMYNPEGSDTGKEWIEIYNDGDSSVDLTNYKLFEAETNHKINPVEEGGSLNIPVGSYALIIDNFSKFQENYSSFSGLVFDSAFSLSNTGENLVIRDGDLNDINSVIYSSDLGANGDGNSLQLISNEWLSANPTIGKVNNSNNQSNQNIEDNYIETNNSGGYTTDFPIEPQIFANAGKDRKVIVGADTMFEAIGLGAERQALQNARYSWSFGDGGSFEGQKTLYSYKYPSKYVVILNVSSGEYTASDRIIVEALPADIVITEVNQTEGFVELHNRSGYELDLSWWRIRSGGEYFSLPKDTIILPDNKIRLFNKVTKFSHLDLNNIYLLYPNGEVVNKYTHSGVFARSGAKRSDEAIQEVSKTQAEQNTHQTFSAEKVYGGQVNSKNEEKITEKVDIENQLAFVGGINEGNDDDGGLFNKWTFSLLGLVLISVVGVLFTKGLEKNEEEDEGLKPEDFRIID